MSSDKLDRLDALIGRLEAALSKLGGGSSSSSGDEKEDAPQVKELDLVIKGQVAAFAAAAKKFPETSKIAEIVEKGFAAMRNVVEAATKCKKEEKAFKALLAPISAAIAEAGKNCDNRQKVFFNHQTAFAEAFNAIGWVSLPGGPKDSVNGALDAAGMYINRVLTHAKSVTGDEQANHRNYCATLKAMIEALSAYGVANYKMGLTWNPKGGDLASFKAGSSSSAPSSAPSAPEAPSAPDAPSAPEPSSSSSTTTTTTSSGSGGMSAVFQQISSAGDKSVTSVFKLNKVTKEMKQQMKSAPSLEPVKKTTTTTTTVKKEETKKTEVKKPTRLEEVKGTWFVENYENTDSIAVNDAQMKENVFISRCKKSFINIPEKVKSITIDNCHNCRINFKSVVSTLEFVNSSRVTVTVIDACPAVAIDKSNGICVFLTKSAIANPPKVVTSNISECNITVPGKDDNADPIEIPIPEQYETTIKYKPGQAALVTEPVNHGGDAKALKA